MVTNYHITSRKVWKIYSYRACGKNVWQIDRLAKWLVIVSTDFFWTVLVW